MKTNFANKMVAAIEAFLTKNIGVDTVVVDGQTLKLNREQALNELVYWKRLASKQARKRGGFTRTIDLSTTGN